MHNPATLPELAEAGGAALVPGRRVIYFCAEIKLRGRPAVDVGLCWNGAMFTMIGHGI